MIRIEKSLVNLLILTLFFCAFAGEAAAQARTKIRYALGDVISIDELSLLIAVERAKRRGVDVEITAFKSEELATQAIINGQADVGQGTPYAALQKVTVPVRFFVQLSALQVFPIVNKESYQSWKDLHYSPSRFSASWWYCYGLKREKDIVFNLHGACI